MTSEFAGADSNEKSAAVRVRSFSPSLVFYIGAAAIYFLAIGPILKLETLGLLPPVVREVLVFLYTPMILLYDNYAIVREIINWYAGLFGEIPRT